MNDELAFRHDEQAGRFLAELDGHVVAYSEVDVIGGQSLLIKHTEVSLAHEGRGYGAALMRFVLGQARAQGKTVIPICPFAAGYIRKHAEHRDLVRR